MIGDFFRISMLSIKHQKLRAWLTIIGIVIGISSIVALITISQGLENAVRAQFSKMGVQDLRVAPKGLTGTPTSGISLVGLTKDDLEVVEKIKGVDYALGVIFKRASVEYHGEEQLISTIAYPTDLAKKAFLDVDLDIEDGRMFRTGEKGSVILGYNIAQPDKFFKKQIRVKNNINIEGKTFKVIGIVEQSGISTIDDNIFIPLEDARILYNKPDEISAMTVHILPGVDMYDVAENIKRKLKKSRGDENFQVFSPEQALERMSEVLGVVSIVLAGIAAISLLVGGIGIMNSMYTSVLERTKDIGAMKAIGATNHSILMIFLIESGLMGFVGGIVGVILGTLVSFGFEAIASKMGFELLLIKIDYRLLIFALAFSFFVGVFSGTLPAIRAAKLKPVDALRYE